MPAGDRCLMMLIAVSRVRSLRSIVTLLSMNPVALIDVERANVLAMILINGPKSARRQRSEVTRWQ